jgi:hypothetical protein
MVNIFIPVNASVVNKISDSILGESSLSRIWTYIEEENRNFGIISPFRKSLPSDENESRYIQLKNIIKKLGYGYIEMKGGYKEDGEEDMSHEKSLFIPEIKKDDLIELGIKFDQDTVIYKNETEFISIGTSKIHGIGRTVDNFQKNGGKDNLFFDKELFKSVFSSLSKGAHKDRKFLFKYLDEREIPSFNKMAYTYRNKELPWNRIYTDKG